MRRSIGGGGGGGGAGAAAAGGGPPPSRPAPGAPAPRPAPPRPAPPPPPRPAPGAGAGGMTTPASTQGACAVPSPRTQPITVCVCSVGAACWAATIAVAAQITATPPSTASFIDVLLLPKIVPSVAGQDIRSNGPLKTIAGHAGSLCQCADQFADILQPIDAFDPLDRPLDPHGRHRQLGAVGELSVELRLRERLVGAATIPLVRRLHDRAAVDEVQFDHAADLVEALGLDLRIEDIHDARHHLLHRRARDELVGELADAGPAAQDQARHQERQAELRLEFVWGVLLAQRIAHVRSGSPSYCPHRLPLYVMSGANSQHV